MSFKIDMIKQPTVVVTIFDRDIEFYKKLTMSQEKVVYKIYALAGKKQKELDSTESDEFVEKYSSYSLDKSLEIAIAMLVNPDKDAQWLRDCADGKNGPERSLGTQHISDIIDYLNKEIDNELVEDSKKAL